MGRCTLCGRRIWFWQHYGFRNESSGPGRRWSRRWHTSCWYERKQSWIKLRLRQGFAEKRS